MKTHSFCLLFLFCLLLSGCQTVETSHLDDSDLPWAHPADWEKNMPIAPGILY